MKDPFPSPAVLFIQMESLPLLSAIFARASFSFQQNVSFQVSFENLRARLCSSPPSVD